jgi:D-glycero-D-manno-heptose 1,7-bisphosphate phosphatase
MNRKPPSTNSRPVALPSTSELKFVFLDRDGVVNKKLPEGGYVTSTEMMELLSGAGKSIARLNEKGIRVLLVTNQRAIALGLLTEGHLQEIHNFLSAELHRDGAHLDGIYHCPHDIDDDCGCRKPSVGLFEQAQDDFPEISSSNCVVIGDSLSDIQAGATLDMYTIFVEGDARTRKSGHLQAAELAGTVVHSLPEAVAALLDR